MALHDFQHCGRTLRDRYVPIAIRASLTAPRCPTCGALMDWLPQVGAMDAKEPFQTSVAYVRQPDGTEQPVTISSLHQMRQIERQSEQAARNGEGQQMVWRDFSNDRNHSDRHTFASDPSERPQKSSRVRVEAVEGSVAEAQGYGPGVGESNTSALGE